MCAAQPETHVHEEHREAASKKKPILYDHTQQLSMKSEQQQPLQSEPQPLSPPRITFFQLFFPIALLPPLGLFLCFFVSIRYHYEVSGCIVPQILV